MALKRPSESDQVDEALASGRDSASLLAAIVDSSEDAIISKTLGGVITSWSLGAERMYGYRSGEMIGRHISLLAPPDCLDEIAGALSRIAHGGGVEHHDTQRICKDGTVLDVAIGRDITPRLALERERRVLETRLNQSERLESLGRLAGGIAHDFNNLLAVILNYSQFVSEQVADNDVARADLGQIRAAAERARELTRQLLAFARREVLQPQVVNLNDVIGDVEQLLRRTIDEKVEVLISLSPDPWLVEADPGQLEQVLVNLAVNARDAMPEGGTLTIDTDNVEIDGGYADTMPTLPTGSYVQLRVSDNGCGMESYVLEHVFEPFFTTKPQGEGTGLGLPMVFGIVMQNGGDIQLYSEPGFGTTCRVLLPSTDRVASVARAAAEPLSLGGSETVLVVEDEDALREVARRILERNGYAVLTSSGGQEAIALAERHRGAIDLLLTDVIMPKMLGKEVAARIGEIRPGTPVLYMSGYARPVLGSTLGEEIELIEKPFSEQLLLSKVRTLLDTPSAPRPHKRMRHSHRR
jgi:PAS domain S-box-containing protein